MDIAAATTHHLAHHCCAAHTVYVMLKRFSSAATDARTGRVTYSLKLAALSRWQEWVPFFYIHRLLRILPPYAFCLALWWKVAPLCGSGPYWYRWQDFIGL
jgi:hypothetical protein